MRLSFPLLRPIPIPQTRSRSLPSPSPFRRALSQTTSRASQRDPRQDRPEYDYDPSLGDPWYYHRLRTARPLFKYTPGRIIRSPWTHTVIAVSVALALGFYWYNLEVVPVSGRTRFNCYSEQTVRQLGAMQYKHVLYDLQQHGAWFLPDRDPRVRMVRRVMEKLVPVSGMEPAGEWAVHVIHNDDPRMANAFVLPGGRVFVFSALLRLARTDDQLAAVLSHEIAHNLAGHISERLSQSIGERFFLGSALMLLAATPFTFIAGYLFGGSLLGLLFSRPMGRMQESEADYIGLMMMAEACYDPREALTFWQRMEAMHQRLGTEPPEFLSTHPSSQHRVERITGWLPKALEKMNEIDCRGTQGFAELFRRAMARGDVIVGGM